MVNPKHAQTTVEMPFESSDFYFAIDRKVVRSFNGKFICWFNSRQCFVVDTNSQMSQETLIKIHDLFDVTYNISKVYLSDNGRLLLKCDECLLSLEPGFKSLKKLTVSTSLELAFAWDNFLIFKHGSMPNTCALYSISSAGLKFENSFALPESNYRICYAQNSQKGYLLFLLKCNNVVSQGSNTTVDVQAWDLNIGKNDHKALCTLVDSQTVSTLKRDEESLLSIRTEFFELFGDEIFVKDFGNGRLEFNDQNDFFCAVNYNARANTLDYSQIQYPLLSENIVRNTLSFPPERSEYFKAQIDVMELTPSRILYVYDNYYVLHNNISRNQLNIELSSSIYSLSPQYILNLFYYGLENNVNNPIKLSELISNDIRGLADYCFAKDKSRWRQTFSKILLFGISNDEKDEDCSDAFDLEDLNFLTNDKEIIILFLIPSLLRKFEMHPNFNSNDKLIKAVKYSVVKCVKLNKDLARHAKWILKILMNSWKDELFCIESQMDAVQALRSLPHQSAKIETKLIVDCLKVQNNEILKAIDKRMNALFYKGVSLNFDGFYHFPSEFVDYASDSVSLSEALV